MGPLLLEKGSVVSVVRQNGPRVAINAPVKGKCFIRSPDGNMLLRFCRDEELVPTKHVWRMLKALTGQIGALGEQNDDSKRKINELLGMVGVPKQPSLTRQDANSLDDTMVLQVLEQQIEELQDKVAQLKGDNSTLEASERKLKMQLEELRHNKLGVVVTEQDDAQARIQELQRKLGSAEKGARKLRSASLMEGQKQALQIAKLRKKLESKDKKDPRENGMVFTVPENPLVLTDMSHEEVMRLRAERDNAVAALKQASTGSGGSQLEELVSLRNENSQLKRNFKLKTDKLKYSHAKQIQRTATQTKKKMDKIRKMNEQLQGDLEQLTKIVPPDKRDAGEQWSASQQDAELAKMMAQLARMDEQFTVSLEGIKGQESLMGSMEQRSGQLERIITEGYEVRLRDSGAVGTLLTNLQVSPSDFAKHGRPH